MVRHPNEPSHKLELGSLYMMTGDYMKAKECYHDAVSVQQAHQPRLEMLNINYPQNIKLYFKLIIDLPEKRNKWFLFYMTARLCLNMTFKCSLKPYVYICIC